MAAVAVATALADGAATATMPRPRPNILLVTLDTTRADHLGASGWRFARTPNLDALARRGVRFSRCDAVAPLTLPSHVSLLTGLLPPHHGVRDNGRFTLAAGIPTVAEILGNAGYDTAAEVSASVLDRSFGLARGFRFYGEPTGGAHLSGIAAERDATATTDAALLDLARLASPFLLWVHYYDAHWPYEAVKTTAGGPTPAYDAEIAHVDAELGRLLASVPADTTVLVVGDHGEMLGERGEPRHGLLPFAGARRVPLLLAGREVPASRTIDTLVSGVDVAPTLLALAGVEPPRSLDGRSLLALARGERASPRLTYTETFFPLFAYGWSPLRAVSDGSTTYVEGARRALYRSEGAEPELRTTAGELEAWHRRLVTTSDERTAPPAAATAPTAEQAAALAALGYAGTTTGPARSLVRADPRDRIADGAFLQEAAGEVTATSCPALLPRLQRLLRQDATDAAAHVLVARCSLALGDALAALRELAVAKAFSVGPDPYLASLEADADLALHRQSAAAAALATVLAADPGDPRAAALAARIARAEGDAARARTLSEGALARGADSAELRFEHAMALAALGQHRDALGEFERSATLAPANPEPLLNAAMLAERRGDAARAADLYDRALRLLPSRADLWRRLGDLYRLTLHDDRSARRAYTAALAHEHDPGRRAELEAVLRESMP